MARTQVQAELIATNAISGTIIADNAITATHIATNSISGTLVQDGGIVTTMIAANNVTSTKIVTDAVQTRHIADDQVTAAKLANSINTDIATGPAALPKAGGTMTGTLNITQASTADTIKLTRSTTAQNNMIKFASAGADKWIVGQRNDSTEHFRFYSYGTSNDVLSIQTDGKVGIGTTSPSAPLDVVTNSTVYAAEFTQSNTSNGDGVLVQVGSTAAADYALTVRSDAGNTSVLAAKADGKVGIGTFSPSAYLDVRAPSGVSGPTIAYFKSDQHGLGIYMNVESTYSEIRSNNNSYPLVLNKASGGNVGIGSATPTKGKLQIDGGSSGSGDFDALAIKHVNTTTTGDGPVMRFEGSYNSNDWALAEMKATNGGAGHGANFQVKLHPGDSVQGSNVLSAFGLKRIVSNQLQVSLHAGGASTYADEASYTISGVANTSCLISIQSQRRAGSNSIAYDAALFFCHYGIDSGASVIELADPGGSFAPTDTDGMVCVYKGNNSANVTVKNRLGYSTGLSIQVIPFLGN